MKPLVVLKLLIKTTVLRVVIFFFTCYRSAYVITTGLFRFSRVRQRLPG